MNDLDTLAGPTVLALDDYHLIDDPAVHDAVTFLLDNLPPQVTVAITTRADPRVAAGPPARPRRAPGDPRGRPEVHAGRGHHLPQRRDGPAARSRRTSPRSRNGPRGGRPGSSWPPSPREGGRQGPGRTSATSSRSSPAATGSCWTTCSRRCWTASRTTSARSCSTPACSTSSRDRRATRSPAAPTGSRSSTPSNAPTSSSSRSTTSGSGTATTTSSPTPCAHGWPRRTQPGSGCCTAAPPPGTPSRGCWRTRSARGRRGGDAELTADLVELALPELSRNREDRALRDQVRTVPQDVARRRPLLASALAWTRLSEGDLDGVEPWLDAAEAALEPGRRAPTRWAWRRRSAAVRARDDELRTLPAMIAVYRASVAQARGDVRRHRGARPARARHGRPGRPSRARRRSGFLGLAAWAAGDLVAAVDTFGQAVRSLESAGKIADALGATVVLAGMWLARGRPDQARRLYEEALAAAQDHPGPPLSTTGDLHVGLADVLREMGQLGAAETHLRSAKDLGDRASLPENRHRWYTAMAGVLRARGDLDGAATMLDGGRAAVPPGLLPRRPARSGRPGPRPDRPGPAARTPGAGPSAAVSPLAEVPSFLTEFDQLTLARLHVAEHRVGDDRVRPRRRDPAARPDPGRRRARRPGREPGRGAPGQGPRPPRSWRPRPGPGRPGPRVEPGCARRVPAAVPRRGRADGRAPGRRRDGGRHGRRRVRPRGAPGGRA